MFDKHAKHDVVKIAFRLKPLYLRSYACKVQAEGREAVEEVDNKILESWVHGTNKGPSRQR